MKYLEVRCIVVFHFQVFVPPLPIMSMIAQKNLRRESGCLRIHHNRTSVVVSSKLTLYRSIELVAKYSNSGTQLQVPYEYIKYFC